VTPRLQRKCQIKQTRRQLESELRRRLQVMRARDSASEDAASGGDVQQQRQVEAELYNGRRTAGAAEQRLARKAETHACGLMPGSQRLHVFVFIRFCFPRHRDAPAAPAPPQRTKTVNPHARCAAAAEVDAFAVLLVRHTSGLSVNDNEDLD
jgi:hypothetical protein